MAGILDKKERIFDIVLTQKGLYDLTKKGLAPKYVSFTDAQSSYNVSGSNLLYFEALPNMSNDIISPISDLYGNISADTDTGGVTLIKGKFIQKTIDDINQFEVLSGSFYNKHAKSFLNKSVIQNFSSLNIIGTKDDVFDRDLFKISTGSINFQLSDQQFHDIDAHIVSGKNEKLVSKIETKKTVGSLRSLFNDDRFIRAIQFQFLPPKNIPLVSGKVPGFTDHGYLFNPATSFGHRRFSEKQLQSNNPGEERNRELVEKFNELLKARLKQLPRRQIVFDKTSRHNNIMCQVFEKGTNSLKKLAIIDYGILDEKRIFFVGKLFVDNSGIKFLNLFTMEFEK
jgi:hypothetical protein